MKELDQTAWEVLNATADDWENLEQIYQMVCFEVVALSGAGAAHQLRPCPGAPGLADIAEHVRELISLGLLEAREEEGGPVSGSDDGGHVWRAWFRMSPAGREAWSRSEWAGLSERRAAK